MSEETLPYIGVDLASGPDRAVVSEVERAEASTEYAKVELMGHRVRWGQVAEVERFGAKLLRICFLDDACEPCIEEYSGAAIFCLTAITGEELDAHQAKQRRWQADQAAYRQRRLLVLEGDCSDPFLEDLEPGAQEED